MNYEHRKRLLVVQMVGVLGVLIILSHVRIKCFTHSVATFCY